MRGWGVYIAIDPGESGGIAYYIIEPPEDITVPITGAFNMPDTLRGVADSLKLLCEREGGGRAVVFMEKTGTYRSHDQRGNKAGVVSQMKFARHCGNLEGIIAGLSATYSISYEDILPRVWQGTLKGFPKDKGERKKAIKQRMQQRFPRHKVTLKTADALGILAVMLDHVKPEFTF